ncbi:MAG: aldo/keto reductase [Nocardioidaceae bacterium]
MKRRVIGRSGVEVTELGFGGAPIGNLYAAVDAGTAAGAVETAWDAGIRCFDTAPHYGLGLSERRLGAALAGKPRGEFTVSTKVGRLLVPNPASTGSDIVAGGFDVPDHLARVRDYSRDGVLRNLDASLGRLGLGHIDIVLVHDPDDHLDQAITESIPSLIELRDQGVIGAVGVGMNYPRPLLRVVTESDVDAVMVAGRWTLADRSGEVLLTACTLRGVSVLAAAPFNSGLLAQAWPPTGRTSTTSPGRRRCGARQNPRARLPEARGDSALPHAAMGFPLRHPAMACVVAGLRTAEQVTSGARWVDTRIPAVAWRDLDDLGQAIPASYG